MAAHTPSPWRIEDPFGPERLSVVAGGEQAYQWQFVAEIDVTGDPDCAGITKAKAKANARLIAAAPDLLIVCKDVEWSGETDREEGGYEPACPQCGASRRLGHQAQCALSVAIAKAEGRS